MRLQQDDTRPYGDTYQNSSATTSAGNGKFSLSVKPLVNTQYRVVAQTSPPTTSAPKLVLVRMLVGVRVSDLTPSRGGRVTFAGSVFPAHDGRLVAIQRRSSTGRFGTVARTTLQDAGDAKSTYSLRVRVNRDGVYRVKVVGDGDHVNGFSRLKSLTVHDCATPAAETPSRRSFSSEKVLARRRPGAGDRKLRRKELGARSHGSPNAGRPVRRAWRPRRG